MAAENSCRAYILHSRPYRESSRLLECFTQNYGRVHLVARGMTRKGAPHSAAQHMFTPLDLAWRSKGSLGSLVRAESLGPHRILSGPGLYTGLYLNELLVRLLAPFDAHPEIFEIYEQQVTSLALHGVQEIALRQFEIRLLQQIGFELKLHQDTDAKPIDPQQQYFYRFGQGAQSQSSGAVAGRQGVWMSGRSLIQLGAQEDYSPETLRDAKRLIRMAFHQILDGRPLHSRELFKRVLKT